MKRNIFKLLFTLIIVAFAFVLTSCEEEEVDHVKVITLQRHADQYLIGQFNYEEFSFMVQYDDGTKKEIFLTEEMLSDYDKMVLLQEGKHTVYAKVLGKTIEVTTEAVCKEMTDLKFEDVSGVYNGEYYTINVEGNIPAGAKIEYVPKNSFKEAGEYQVEAIVSCENYITKHMLAKVTIEQAVYDLSSFTFEDFTTTYNGEDQKLEIKGQMPEGLKYYYTISQKPTPQDTDIKGNSASSAGTYYVTLHITGDKANYSSDNLTITRMFVINKKDIQLDTKEINMKDMIVEYDGKYHSITLNEDKLPENVSVEYINNVQINAGEYEVKAIFTLTDSINYKIVNYLTAKLTITKATYDMSKVVFEDQTFGYDGEAHSLSYSGTLPRGVELAYYENNNQVKAGEYNVSVNFKINDSNHYPIEPLVAKLTISKASFTSTSLSMEGGTYTYDGNLHEVKLNGEIPAGVQVVYKAWNDKATDLGNITKFTDVGVYTVVATFKFEKENYEEFVDIADVSATLEIKIREFNEENQLPIEDLEYTYDGTDHGNSNDINLPSWTIMKSFTLLDSKGVPISEAVNAGDYFYYYTYEYFNGVETIIENSRTASIKINKMQLKNGVHFKVDSFATKTYDGNVFDTSVEFMDVPDQEELLNSVSITVKDNNGDVVENAINAGIYEIIYAFIEQTNYTFDVSSAKKNLSISKIKIDVNDANFKVSDVTLDYDGLEHYPTVVSQPEHTTVAFSVKYENLITTTYDVTLSPENDNYTLNGTSVKTARVTVNNITLSQDNIGVKLLDNETLINASNITYAPRSYKNTSGEAIAFDSQYNNAKVQRFSVKANGQNKTITSLFEENFSNLKDAFTLSECELIYVRNDKVAFDLGAISSFDEINNYLLTTDTDGLVNFGEDLGTPYGTYLLYYTVTSSDPKISSGTGKFVAEVIVSKQEFDASKYFTTQELLWLDETNNSEPYVYDVSKLGDLPTGVTINNNISKFNRSYDAANLLIYYDLNINMYGINSGSYSPLIIVKNRNYDFSKMSIRYSTIIYDAENHQHTWGDVNKIVNMNSEILDLIDSGAITVEFDTKNGKSAIIPGSYEVKVTFVSNNPHLILTNTALIGSDDAVISSVIIIQKKLITTDQIEQAAKNAVVVRGNETEDNISVSVDYVEKEEIYQKTFVYTDVVYNDCIENKIRFTRGDSVNRYLTPLPGMVLTSVDYTNERGDVIYSVENDLYIRKSSDLNTYNKSLVKPIVHEYYVLHFELDSYTSLIDTDETTYDLYIRNDSVAIDIKPESQKIAYTGIGKTLAIENQAEISKLVSFAYVYENDTESTTPEKYDAIGKYNVGIKIYSFNGSGEQVLIGSVNKDFEITKIMVTDTYFDAYLYKTVEWNGSPISIFAKKDGFKLPDHVVISKIYVDDEELLTNDVSYTELCSHTVRIEFDVDDAEHYELAADQVEYTYTFEIVKARIEAELVVGETVINDDNTYAYADANNNVVFKVNNPFIQSLASVSYRKCLSSESLDELEYSSNAINLASAGNYKLQVKVEVNSQYEDYCEFGHYVEGVFTPYTFDEETLTYDAINVVEKIDLNKINMRIENGDYITKAFEGKMYNIASNEYVNVVFGEIEISYTSDGYVISFSPEAGYYEISNYILINEILGSKEGANVSSDSITIIGLNTFRLSTKNFVPGDYYIGFAHNLTYAANNNYYNDCEYDTYLGIHLIIK